MEALSDKNITSNSGSWPLILVMHGADDNMPKSGDQTWLILNSSEFCKQPCNPYLRDDKMQNHARNSLVAGLEQFYITNQCCHSLHFPDQLYLKIHSKDQKLPTKNPGTG